MAYRYRYFSKIFFAFFIIAVFGCGKTGGKSVALTQLSLVGSTISATQGNLSADGTATSSLIVHLVDQFGKSVSGKTIAISTNRPSVDTLSTISAVTDAIGQATFQISSTAMGTSTVSATDSTDSLSLPFGVDITFSAAAILPNLKLWLKGDSISLGNNAAVSTWSDISGQGNDAAQGNGSLQPTFKTNVVNGTHAAVLFNGTDNYLTTSLSISAPCTFFVVYNYTGSCGSNNAHRAINGSSNWLIGPYDGYVNVFFASSYVTGGCAPVSTFILQSVTQTGASGSATGTSYFNGANLGSINNGLDPGVITVGGRGGTEALNGMLAEVLVYNILLSTAQRQSVESYLNGRYSLY